MLSKYVAKVDPRLYDVTSISTVMDIMKKGKLHRVFSELHILLRLYLTIPLSNATAERRTEFFSSQESKNLLQKPPYTRTLESLPYAPLP